MPGRSNRYSLAAVDREPQYVDGFVRVPLESGRIVDLTPRECWQLAETARTYLFDNFSRFADATVRAIRANNRQLNVAIIRNDAFWQRVQNGTWEPNTLRILDDFVSADRTFLDIGAWIGPTALYAAQLAKRTYAFEPDPVAYEELEVNARANADASWASRLTVYHKAVVPAGNKLRLGSRTSGGDSTSSVFFATGQSSWEVDATTLDAFVAAEQLHNEKLFIKIDIEGGEYELIPSLTTAFRKYDVVLFLSIHPWLSMSRLIQSGSRTALGQLVRRFRFVRQHIQLVRALPFRHLYHSNGQPFSLGVESLRALWYGTFAGEVLATNVEWSRSTPRSSA